jgi:hypothetical protein
MSEQDFLFPKKVMIRKHIPWKLKNYTEEMKAEEIVSFGTEKKVKNDNSKLSKVFVFFFSKFLFQKQSKRNKIILDF